MKLLIIQFSLLQGNDEVHRGVWTVHPMIEMTVFLLLGDSCYHWQQHSLLLRYAYLELLEQEPTITLVKAAEKLGWKETLVKYYVASLKKKKMLSRNGTSHNGVWVVSKD